MRLQEIHLKTSEANAQFMSQNEAFNTSRNILWELISLAAAFIFVEGFANAKKCSNEGRALMQLDYRFVNEMIIRLVDVESKIGKFFASFLMNLMKMKFQTICHEVGEDK